MLQLINQREDSAEDPNVRMIQASGSEDGSGPKSSEAKLLRWVTFWFTGIPPHISYERVEGSIQPN
jgi:hypothetical protein